MSHVLCWQVMCFPTWHLDALRSAAGTGKRLKRFRQFLEIDVGLDTFEEWPYDAAQVGGAGGPQLQRSRVGPTAKETWMDPGVAVALCFYKSNQFQCLFLMVGCCKCLVYLVQYCPILHRSFEGIKELWLYQA
jgi:hypothetical protein